MVVQTVEFLIHYCRVVIEVGVLLDELPSLWFYTSMFCLKFSSSVVDVFQCYSSSSEPIVAPPYKALA